MLMAPIVVFGGFALLEDFGPAELLKAIFGRFHGLYFCFALLRDLGGFSQYTGRPE